MNKDLVRIPLKSEDEFKPKHTDRNICIGLCSVFIALAAVLMIFSD